MSNGKITYLMGAGASAQALPVLSNFGAGVDIAIKYLELWIHDVQSLPFRHNVSGAKFKHQDGPIGVWNSALTALRELYRVCLHHATVDTHCRMLYLTNSDASYIKNALSLFFQLSAVRSGIQLLDNSLEDSYRALDLRYDAFLASIIPKRYDELPASINVLSWNYDDQFERAYSRYLNVVADIHQHPEQRLNVFSKFSSSQRVDDFDPEKFFIYKLNGTATFRASTGKPWTNASGWQLDSIDDVLTAFDLAQNGAIDSGERVRSHISFSWEEREQDDLLWYKLLDALSQTRTLVVVGYSFPFFNRNVDKILLTSMPHLKHIVLQEPNAAIANSTLERIAQRLPGEMHLENKHFVNPSRLKLQTHKIYESRTDFYIPSSFN